MTEVKTWDEAANALRMREHKLTAEQLAAAKTILILAQDAGYDPPAEVEGPFDTDYGDQVPLGINWSWTVESWRFEALLDVETDGNLVHCCYAERPVMGTMKPMHQWRSSSDDTSPGDFLEVLSRYQTFMKAIKVGLGTKVATPHDADEIL